MKKEVSARRELAEFAEICRGLDNPARLRLILVASGAKPACFIPLKIEKNYGDKLHLQRHLKKAGLIFEVSAPKTFEEITKVSRNKIMWSMKGTWYGYDIFQNRRVQKLFHRHKRLLQKGKPEKADKIAGKLYGYPPCCIRNFLKEQNPDYLRKAYTAYEYYKKLHDMDRAFPFIAHTACSPSCKKSLAMNRANEEVCKDFAPRFWERYSSTVVKKTDLLVEGESMVYDDCEPVWPEPDGHEYSLIALSEHKGHHMIMSYLTRKSYERGTVLEGSVRIRYNYADVSVRRKKSLRKNIMHIRHFPKYAA